MAYTASAKAVGNSSPAWDAVTITPDDTTKFTQGLAVGFFVGTGGNVSVLTAGGSTTIFKNLSNGQTVPQMCQRINQTNTTASDIIAYFS